MHFVIQIRKALGAFLAANFLVFWAIPIFAQGYIYHKFLHRFLRQIYNRVDGSSRLRCFAGQHIYSKAVHVDYFAQAVLFMGGFIVSLGTVIAWQVSTGSLPWWLVAFYYFAWVGGP